MASRKEVSLPYILFPNQRGFIPKLKHPDGTTTPIIESNKPVFYTPEPDAATTQAKSEKKKPVVSDEILPCLELDLDFGVEQETLEGYSLELTSSGYQQEHSLAACQSGNLYSFCFTDIIPGLLYSARLKKEEEEKVLFISKNIDHFIDGVGSVETYVEPLDTSNLLFENEDYEETLAVVEHGPLSTEDVISDNHFESRILYS